MNVRDAQHQLLDVLINAHPSPSSPDCDEPGDPLLALVVGLALARGINAGSDEGSVLMRFLAALEDLVDAVRDDLCEETTFRV
jgi:hypothetical protein